MTMGGAGPLVEMSTASSPEWDKDLNRNFKATSVSSTPPLLHSPLAV